jgi:muramoyltetrapeptide carboxypeptidase
MSNPAGSPLKPKPLRRGARIAYFAPASPPSDPADMQMGILELRRLGFDVVAAHEFLPSGYFAAPAEERLEGFLGALRNPEFDALVALRGGYGSTYLLDSLLPDDLGSPKCIIGYSDLTALETFLWQQCRWVTFYGPMLSAGFDHGPNDLRGFDDESFLNAISNINGNWSLNLRGESLAPGEAEGVLLGGCLTMLQTSLGTPWEIETAGAILLLEDTHMRPYQVDRALMHLKQAGKFAKVRAIILGEFPGSEPSIPGTPTVRAVCKHVLTPLGIPVVYGACVGHAERAMLTIPLGIHARLRATGEGALEFLEPAVKD